MSDSLTSKSSTSSENHPSLAEEIFDTVHEPMLVLDVDLSVQKASSTFYDHFRMSPEDTLGRKIYDLGNNRWDIPELHTLLENIVPKNEVFNGFEVQYDFDEIGQRTMLFNARRIDHLQLILLAFEDITERKQSEKALDESEKLCRTLVQNFPRVATFILDRNLRYVLAGGQALECAGFSPADFEGKSIWEALDAATVEEYEPFFRKVLAGEKFRYEHASHEKFYMSEGVPLQDADGAVTRILVTSYDITDRKNTEDIARLTGASAREALREIEDLYRNAPVGLCVLDRGLRFVRINARLAEINGISAEGHIGKTVREILPQLADAVERDMRRIIETGEPRLDVEIVGETPAQPGVKRSWVEQWLPIFDDQGRVSGISIVAEETTARKKTERALRESEQRLRIALDSAYVILFEWDIQKNDVRRLVSHEAALESTADKKPETFEDVLEVVHPDDRELFKSNVAAALDRKDGEYENEYRLVRLEGEITWLYERGRVERNAAGHPIRLIGLSQDITHRKKAETELKEAKAAADKASQAKGEFLANMSHEIRTPMTIFLGALEYLEQIERNPKHRQLLQMADKSAKNLRELIDDILDFSRIEAGQVDILEAPLDVRSWLEDAVDMFRALAREKNLRLSTQIDDKVPAIIEADASRLRQILNNLLGNAIKFTSRGEVKVTVEALGEYLALGVTDTGIGISEDKQHLLFKSFSQVDSSFQRDYGGTGLGLAISKKLAELMDGRISVQSREGEGSTFTLTLPLKMDSSLDHGASAERESLPGNALPYSILLVEDDPMIRELFIMGLTPRGAHIDAASSGEKALRMWQPGKFDVVLMDLQMPGMDGLEATRQIRARETESGEHVHIIGVTAHARQKVIEDCLKGGMDEVLTKPIQIRELEEVLLRCMAK